MTRPSTSPRRRKYQQALKDGRLLRNAKGHIVKSPVNDPGVLLRPTPPPLPPGPPKPHADQVADDIMADRLMANPMFTDRRWN